MRKQKAIPSWYAESLLFVKEHSNFPKNSDFFFSFMLCIFNSSLINECSSLWSTVLCKVHFCLSFVRLDISLPSTICPFYLVIQVLQGRGFIALSSNSGKCSCTSLVFPCPDTPEQNSAFTPAFSCNNDGCGNIRL